MRGRALREPELPDAARPQWPPWSAPAALFSAFGAIVVAGLPLLPVLITFGISEAVAGVALLALLLVQDGLLVLAAVLFASMRLRPRPWHFGIRATRLWPTVGWALLAFALMLALELGYIELFQVDETNVEELGEGSLVAGFAVSTAVIVVAPVAEEIFFRAFFYRALRTRLPVWSAALIDGVVFGAPPLPGRRHGDHPAGHRALRRRTVPGLRTHRLAVRGDRHPRRLQHGRHALGRAASRHPDRRARDPRLPARAPGRPARWPSPVPA